ncbi:hypothetical protein LC085_20955 [Bacillus tianshenii]|uniref:hypothetical protein n=1 Tax=Sutcliffiella tianshenii TaxID=1463404 RepID=UPI001CD72BEF|nr:hypothetical protein [Bacillus tianshenii]MCA1322352.1 hypothetical protein [Bacillus tianshenii]
MNKKLVVDILRRKTHHFLTISLVIMIVSFSMINFMSSYMFNQYEMINRDYLTNNNVKVIHVNGKAEGSSTGSIVPTDGEGINELLKAENLKEEAKAYPVYILPTIFDEKMEIGYSVMGISQELAFLIGDGCTLKDESICIKGPAQDRMEFNIPIIEEKDGGYSSENVKTMSMSAEAGATNENSILIHSIPGNNQAYMNEKQSLRMLESMFENSSNSFDYIKETQLDKVIVYVKDIKDVDTVGTLLKEKGYFTSYTFNSFENFSVNISSMQMILIILGVIFVLTSIVTAVLLLINFIRIQKKEMAILKLNGYRNEDVISIYTRLIVSTLQKVFIISLFIFVVCFFIDFIPISWSRFLLIIGMDLLILILTLIIVYFMGIRKIGRLDMMELLKKGKEFE